MAVPKKKTSRSRSSTRHQTFVKLTQKKLADFVERGKRNEKGAAKVAAAKAPSAKKKVTKIAA